MGGEVLAAPDEVGARICRVLPDVTAVERAFDYLVPDALGPDVSVGAIVRVVLNGRRVRGWVLADDVDSDVEVSKLRPLLSVSSMGPPAQVIELCELVAHRYCGPVAPLLRSASPLNNVPPGSVRRVADPLGVGLAGPSGLASGLASGLTGGLASGLAGGLAGAANDIDRAADALMEQVVDRDFAVLRWPPRFDRRRLVGQLLARSGSSIVLTADGARAAAFAAWLRSHGVRVALLHSDSSRAALTDAWRIAAAGSCVVVGGRMATFAPVPDLQCAIVLDDADEALQEERAPTWHARDVVLERAESCGARRYVISPAPSVAVAARVPEVVALPLSSEASGWPRVEVIDLRESDPTSGILSDQLVDSVRRAVDARELAVLILNRRGGVRLLKCASCNALNRWDAHGRPLWEHDAPADIEVKPSFCGQCGGTKLRLLSAGITKVAEQLSLRLGGVATSVVDAAIAEAPDVPVLVGTEALLHRREVRHRRPSLVAFIDFDAELFAARYGANEQALWLVVRASHVLSGRERGDGRVLLQTHDPRHEVVVACRDGNPGLLTETELARRQLYELPPFAAIAQITGDAPAISECALQLAAIMVTEPALRVDRSDNQLLVHAPDGVFLAGALAIATAAARAVGKIRVAIDPPRI